MTVRVRFAPSPTGTLHLGSARSALYNWLYARHHGVDGTYVLRIEDTDQQRSTPEHVEQALAVFRWLGLEWDEGPEVSGSYGPYFQSERFDAYRARLEELRSAGRAYRCFCSKQQLEADRAAAEAERRPFVYPGRCREISPEEGERRAAAGDDHVVRFRVPDEGTTVVEDLILGDTVFENALVGDFVIARADGSPLYNFANVVDDAHMRITHVVRGNDHLSNTPKQIMLYEALGEPVPVFAHVPMILGPDGAKLSKRHVHASTVEQLAAEGYVPEAVRNGLALLGWSKDDVTEVMTTTEMVEAFDVARVKKSPAKVDYDKLRWLNGQHLRMMSPEQFAEAFDAWRTNWLDAADERSHWAAAVTPEQAAYLAQEKVETLGEVPGLVAFLREPFEMTDEAWGRLLKVDDADLVLEHASSALRQSDGFDAATIEAALRELCETLGKKPGKLFGPIRFAVTGRTVTPGLFESIATLGRERTIERIAQARARLQRELVDA